MKKDIVLAGVGGQGILTIAAAIGHAAIEAGLFIKQSEVHGMSQRGGDVQSNFRLSDKQIASDLIPEGQADIIISVEPMEALRHLPMLSEDGWLISNSNPHINIPNYPDTDEVIRAVKMINNHVLIDANKLALDLGSRRSANMIILGAAIPFLELEHRFIRNAIKKLFGKKGEEIVEQNHKALQKGKEFAEDYLKK
ncbi:MAG: indolepyruvate oxidoreductase subunit beta [Bacteroidales bacterium]|nr:indolepyruvate oxidoreductase subunit beta [Bacteroidales bacterium]